MFRLIGLLVPPLFLSSTCLPFLPRSVSPFYAVDHFIMLFLALWRTVHPYGSRISPGSIGTVTTAPMGMTTPCHEGLQVPKDDLAYVDKYTLHIAVEFM